MSGSDEFEFALVQKRGYSSDELVTAPTLEEIEEFLQEKGGR